MSFEQTVDLSAPAAGGITGITMFIEVFRRTKHD